MIAAMRFSGGKDSVLAAIRMSSQCERLDLLTFRTRMIADVEASRLNANRLAKMLATKTRITHSIIDIEASVRYFFQPRGWLDNWRKYGSYACCCMCNSCDFAMDVHTVLYCARNVIKLAFDGVSRTEFAGFTDDWGLPKIQEFAARYNVRWEFPIYEEKNTGLSMLEAGLKAEVPQLLYRSQPNCLGGGYMNNIYMRCYYLPRYGSEDYRKTSLRWLDDRIELACRFIDEQLKTPSGRNLK
jgi:hypothetical protein